MELIALVVGLGAVGWVTWLAWYLTSEEDQADIYSRATIARRS